MINEVLPFQIRPRAQLHMQSVILLATLYKNAGRKLHLLT